MLDHNQFATRTKRAAAVAIPNLTTELPNLQTCKRLCKRLSKSKRPHAISYRFQYFSFFLFFPPPEYIYVILVRNILGSVGAQILPDIYTHLFPGGCLLSVLAATRYRLEADVTVKIEKQLLLLLLLLSCSEWGKGRRSGERDLSVPWACGSDVWTGSIINGVSRNFWFHGHSGIFTLLGIVPLLMTRDSELELYFCDGLISEIAPSVWV